MDLAQKRVARVGGDDREEVRLHVLENEVHVLVRLGLDHLQHPDQVVVPRQLGQVHDLAVGPLRVDRVAKGLVALLERHQLTRALLDRFPHHAVGAHRQALAELIPPQHVLLHQLVRARCPGEFVHRRRPVPPPPPEAWIGTLLE